MDTYNIYMDEVSADGLNGESDLDIEFRVVPSTGDSSDGENEAVVVGLDLVDLINLRDALQMEIDNVALASFELEEDGEEEEEVQA